MSQGTSFAAGFDQRPEALEEFLSILREALHMDVAFVSELVGNRLVFRALEGDAESFGWKEGTDFPFADTYCKKVVDNRISNVVPDVKSYEPTRDPGVASEAYIGSYVGMSLGSYVGMPLWLSDGRLYGTLCCVSHTPDLSLRERGLKLMQKTAYQVVEHLEQEEGRL